MHATLGQKTVCAKKSTFSTKHVCFKKIKNGNKSCKLTMSKSAMWKKEEVMSSVHNMPLYASRGLGENEVE